MVSKSSRYDSEDVEQFEAEEDVDKGRCGSNSAPDAALFIDRSNGWLDSSSLQIKY